jgi:hypothetical protein
VSMLRRVTRTPSGAAVGQYVAAWHEPDPGVRRALLGACWAVDGVYSDPLGRAEGRDGLCAHITTFRERLPGARIDMVSGVDEHDGYLRFAWRMLSPDGAVTLEGVDFGEIDDAGLLRRIVGFFGPLPPREPGP